MENMDNIIKKTSPKDVFLHFLSIVTLYASAISFLVLVFEYINVLIPDRLDYGPYNYILSNSYSTIRFAISTLIVVFPVYIFSVWYLNKIYKTYPEKLNLRIRKWLIYFTLFIAALVIMGDLATLIYNLLGGELTMRFFLKIIAVFFVTGSVFGYYIYDLKKHGAD